MTRCNVLQRVTAVRFFVLIENALRRGRSETCDALQLPVFWLGHRLFRWFAGSDFDYRITVRISGEGKEIKYCFWQGVVIMCMCNLWLEYDCLSYFYISLILALAHKLFRPKGWHPYLLTQRISVNFSLGTKEEDGHFYDSKEHIFTVEEALLFLHFSNTVGI